MADEQLILVDEDDRATGTGGKTDIHRAGLLHRAFSIFVVNGEGRILLQQRNREKYHSGGLWANSCCGHPRPGERTVDAASRRLNEELGIVIPLTFGFFARYRADLDHGMQENEFVHVYFGLLQSAPQPNPVEVADVAYLSADEIQRRVQQKPETFAYWFRHYMATHGADIARLAKDTASLLGGFSRRRNPPPLPRD
jgi:isopentenyl-diphosphate delta-isomerase